jgi:hypothetical protein
MTMVGAMFDDALKRRVEALAADLAALHEDGAAAASPAGRSVAAAVAGARDAWWPHGLGTPDTAGAQNDVRYAWFAGSRRLAIERGGKVTVYDTLDHRIGGVAQQQGGTSSLSFTSQHGPIDVERLPVVG